MTGFLDMVRRRVRPRAATGPVILMYHRIAQPRVDPWGLAVRPDHFEEHLTVLCRSRRPLHMSEFVQRLERRALPPDAVAVTFDDGYVDNVRQAEPRLTAAGVPATLFVTTGALGQSTEYWWDELARGILLRDTPLDCEVMIGGEPCRLVLPQAGSEPDCTWRAWEEPRSEREATYLAVWRRLQVAAAAEREAAMNRLRDVLNAPPPDVQDLPMAPSDVAKLSAGGLFEIGGHTVTHPVLPAVDPDERRREIRQGKLACEALINRPIAGFAYPHGAFDADSRAAVQECGFAWACSTDSRTVSHRDYDRYALPRVSALDCDGDAFGRALQAAHA